MDTITKILDKIEKYMTNITSVMIIILTLLISFQVFIRYVLNTGQFWIQELSVMMMMWIAFLGAAAAVWDNSHIGLNFVVESFPISLKVWTRVLNDFIILVFSVLFFNYGLTLISKTMGGTLSALGFSIGYTYIIIPVSAFLMALFSIVKIINRIRLFYFKKQGGLN